MLARHQHAPRGGTNGVTAVVLRKPHAFGRQAIQVGRLDFLLTVAPQFGIAQIVRQDVNDVRGLLGGELPWGRHEKRESTQNYGQE
jgi:hypothetical protein